MSQALKWKFFYLNLAFKWALDTSEQLSEWFVADRDREIDCFTVIEIEMIQSELTPGLK